MAKGAAAWRQGLRFKTQRRREAMRGPSKASKQAAAAAPGRTRWAGLRHPAQVLNLQLASLPHTSPAFSHGSNLAHQLSTPQDRARLPDRGAEDREEGARGGRGVTFKCGYFAAALSFSQQRRSTLSHRKSRARPPQRPVARNNGARAQRAADVCSPRRRRWRRWLLKRPTPPEHTPTPCCSHPV